MLQMKVSTISESNPWEKGFFFVVESPGNGILTLTGQTTWVSGEGPRPRRKTTTIVVVKEPGPGDRSTI